MAQREDEIFKALADGHRRRIMSSLCDRPMVAGELAKLVGLAPNAVSFHLKVLQSADLVTVKREGRFLRYGVRADVLEGWRSRVNLLFVPGSDATAMVQTPRGEPSRVSTGPPVAPSQPLPVVNKSPDRTIAEDNRLPTQLL